MDSTTATAAAADITSPKTAMLANGVMTTGTAGGSIPCTGIALDFDSLSFDTVGEQKRMTATVTPSNTTDSIVWSSSDTNVATVSGGLVTIHGIGSATITATCGSQTAMATIRQTSIRPEGTFSLLMNYIPYPYGNEVTLDGSSGRYALGNTYTGDDTVRMINGSSLNLEMIRVPYGATKVKVATQNYTGITLDYMYLADCDDLVVYHDENYPRYLERIADVNSAAGASVAFGKCVAFALYTTPSDMPAYVYFE